MKIITFLAQKGGTGKTTLILSVAVAWAKSGMSVMVVDTDPQKSAANWFERREPELQESSPFVVYTEAANLERAIAVAKERNFDAVLIDTAGHHAEHSAYAIEIADTCIVPCRPSMMDLQASVTSVIALKQANKDFAFVLNQTSVQKRRSDTAMTSLKNVGLVCPVSIVQRVTYQDAYFDGVGVTEFEPNGKAAEEIGHLAKWLAAFPKTTS